MANKSRKKRCGGCKFWLKLRFCGRVISGLCLLEDVKCPSDYSCSKWSAKPYKRNKFDKNNILIV